MTMKSSEFPIHVHSLVDLPVSAGAGSGTLVTTAELLTLGLKDFRVVADLATRDALVPAERTEGMHVYSVAEGVAYVLAAGLTNADWLLAPGYTQARRELNIPGLAATLYVDPVSGDDLYGDGGLGTPYKSITRALLDVGMSNPSTVTLQLAAGTVSLPAVLTDCNYVTIAGAPPVYVATGTVSAVVHASDAAGLSVTVTGLPAATLNSLAGTLVKWTSGAATGRYGWIYRNTATSGGAVTVYMSQDDANTLRVPVTGDTFDTLALGTTLDLSGAGSSALLGSIQLNVRDVIVANGGSPTTLFVNSTDKIELSRCLFTNRHIRAGFGGSAFLTTCYVRATGAAVGLVAAARGGDLRYNKGTVIDGSLAPANKRYVSGASGASVSYRGQTVLTSLTHTQDFDGVSWACGTGLGPHHSFLFDPSVDGAPLVCAGFRFNARGQGGGGGGDLPNLHGEVSGAYVASASNGFIGALGPASTVKTAHPVWPNTVSADGGVTLTAIQPSTVTRIGNGYPSTGGFSPVLFPRSVATNTYTASRWDAIQLSLAAGPTTVALPADAVAGDRVSVRNIGNLDLLITVVAQPGATVEHIQSSGAFAVLTGFSGPGVYGEWEYDAGSAKWRAVVASHDAQASLAHDVSATSYYEVVRDGAGRMTTETWWATSAKLQKIREHVYARVNGRVQTVIRTQYDAAGLLLYTQTETIARTAGRIASVNITKV